MRPRDAVPTESFVSRTLLTLALVACGSATPTDPDGDADGFPASMDCNDADSTIFPGAVDRWNDTVDADCDGSDGGTGFLTDALTLVTHSTDDDRFGAAVVVCDLDGDAQDDLIVGRPNGENGSEILVLPGPFTQGEFTSAAATVTFQLTGTGGYDLHCGDVDGDGLDDLITWQITEGAVWGEVVVFPQPAEGFPAAVDTSAAELHEVDLFGGESPPLLLVAELDGIVGEEIIISRRLLPNAWSNFNASIVLGGPRPTFRRLIEHSGAQSYSLTALHDLDGNGLAAVVHGRDHTHICAVVDGVTTSTYVEEQLVGVLSPGSSVVSGDFDGDGATNDLFVKPWNASYFSTVPDALPVLAAQTTLTPFGTNVVNVESNYADVYNLGDLDNDRADDVRMVQRVNDRIDVRLMSGASTLEPSNDVDATTLFRWRGSEFASVAQGDLDGDGRQDLVIGSSTSDHFDQISIGLSSTLFPLAQ
jgi:hypothetical protein